MEDNVLKVGSGKLYIHDEKKEVKSILGTQRTEMEVTGVVKPDRVLEDEDILVLYGSNKDLEKFLHQKIHLN